MATKKTSAKAAAASKTVASKPVASKPVAPKPVEAAVETAVETAAAAGKETVEAAVKAGTEAASAGYKQAADLAKQQVERTSKAFKGYGDFTALGQDNMDAVVKSGTVVAKGLEVLSKEMMDFAKASFEDNVAATKAMLGAKNLTDLVNLQTRYTQNNLDHALSEGTKLTELSVRVASEAFEPIKARVDTAVGQMVKPVGF
jgi:phasin family protein